MKSSLLLGVALGAFVAAAAQSPVMKLDPYNYASQKSFTGRNGAVVSAHPLASQAGVSVLKKGGNAIDAAIATQLALAVVYPAAGNIGGGGFFVAHLSTGENITIDFREKAPQKGHRDMYLDPAGNAAIMADLR